MSENVLSTLEQQTKIWFTISMISLGTLDILNIVYSTKKVM